ANPKAATSVEAAASTPPAPGQAQSAFNNFPPFAPSPMPYVNGPMILAHRIICDETGQQSYCQRAEQLAPTTPAVYQSFWMGPQFDFWYARTMLEFARRDDSADWYGIVQ